jgi:hypothetical protein
VGDQPSLGRFVAGDSFLRHIDRRRHIAGDGTIAWGVFKPRSSELSLSFTYRDEALKMERVLDEYQQDKMLPHGDLPGICYLSFYDLTESLDPPLPPRSEPYPADEKYGHLHCITDIPRDEIHMEKMAKLATRNGVLRPFVRASKKEGVKTHDRPVG